MQTPHHIYLARALRIFELTRRKRFSKTALSELIDGDPDATVLDMIIEQYGLTPPKTQYSKKMVSLAHKRALQQAK
ncbi:hypothetical protein Ga0123462_0090 [Mariprofundus ferrinatatus]|uniref:Uncharacterized protein n=1 Tax=Mariprofundus ferrinatatus TaxID=1921087 RepID=A0A2K8L410_9PROT|nr:hypothetical protein [Mariprofundus ferrinatatus]ATX80969.1 hypothetical protein Ga0123462_0090 [Mariprofundus ferrinatatus]